jgi:FtsH-binding integral membrane protein
VLAETVSLDAGDIAVILAILLVIVLVAVAIVVFGFVLAPRAGRGSSQAMNWWSAILVVEGLFCLGSVAEILTGQFTLWAFAPLAVVGGQVALYMRARNDAGR